MSTGLFSVTDVDGGFWVYRRWRSDIYVHQPGGDSLYVGTIESETMPNYMGVSSAPDRRARRTINLAVSMDGRSIVFRHATALAPRHAKLRSGVYRYTAGEGVVLLREYSRVGGWWIRENIGLRRRSVPSDLLPIAGDALRTDTSWAFSTNGTAFPLILVESSPLHRAAFEGRTEDCVSLIQGGADVRAETYWGYTPLHLAIIGGHDTTAVRLLRLGATARPGGTEWQFATDLGRLGVVEALLQQGVALNARDSLGNTMLHRSVAAALSSQGIPGFFTNITTPTSLKESGVTVQLLRLLLDRGADPSLRNAQGHTAIDLVSALIDTTPARPGAPPARSRLPFRNANYPIDSLAYEHDKWKAVFRTYLIELRSILLARMKG